MYHHKEDVKDDYSNFSVYVVFLEKNSFDKNASKKGKILSTLMIIGQVTKNEGIWHPSLLFKMF